MRRITGWRSNLLRKASWIQRPAISKLPLVLGVSDPPFCFPGGSRLLDCTLTNNLFLPGGVLGVLRSREVHITWRKTIPLLFHTFAKHPLGVGYLYEGGTCRGGGWSNFHPPPPPHLYRAANANEEAADFSSGVFCPVNFHG